MKFVTDYSKILEKIDTINPIEYVRTRNYLDGAVTYLSPYISRGVISTHQVLKSVLSKGFVVKDIESFVKELCWRDYFQRVAQVKDINREIKNIQTPVINHQIPRAILDAQTGIEAIDKALLELKNTGYMHNHCRMYVASIVCNIAQTHWLHPAQWMYYHLLDGDWASNACSWQWVAGANSNKKYYASQENINKFCHSHQRNGFLNTSYENLPTLQIPDVLKITESFIFKTELPKPSTIEVDVKLPSFIYNYYNLDPLWHKYEVGNRILLLEPSHFEQYPIGKKNLEFAIELSKNIENIQLYIGSFEDLQRKYHLTNIVYKEHPFNAHYQGTMEQRDWIVAEVTGFHPSFFTYWKQIEKHLKKRTT
jgi:deoxyribodipyrimidine photo-lyase